jgi:hypothetical protein
VGIQREDRVVTKGATEEVVKPKVTCDYTHTWGLLTGQTTSQVMVAKANHINGKESYFSG